MRRRRGFQKKKKKKECSVYIFDGATDELIGARLHRHVVRVGGC